MRQTFLVVLALVVVLGAGQQGIATDMAADDEISRATLKGLRGVRVFVMPLAEDLDLTKRVEADAELQLRRAGIKVLTADERKASRDKPLLSISADRTVLGGTATYWVEIDLFQAVALVRDPNMTILAKTWSARNLASNASSSSIRSSTKNLLSQFLVAWLSVNPKK